LTLITLHHNVVTVREMQSKEAQAAWRKRMGYANA
jgi:hypothetical protein